MDDLIETAHVSRLPGAARASSVLAVGFGTTVAMWAVGYVGRLPAVLAPSPVLLALLLVCLFSGGWVLGRYASLGWPHGAAVGLLSGLLNLLILGSFLVGERSEGVVPSAALWLPGSILLASLLAGAGSLVGAQWFRRDPPYREWSAAFVRVGIAAALLLLAIGGLVTSAGAGLAVVDWPNSFGYNMFLYPFSRMTGGIYYEHAHRLFGALVGLTTLVLALLLQFREPRSWVRRLGWLAFLMVVVQGILGGLRVTGGFTLESAAESMRPNLTLALVHGVLGQLFFATLVALGVFTSVTWRGPTAPLRRASARLDRVLSGVLVGLIVGQLVLGAVQRHMNELLLMHIAFGVAVVAPLTIHVGFRAWGLNEGQPLLQRLGQALVVALGLQIVLGLAAYAGRGTPWGSVELALTTLHQWFGAVLLALTVMLLCWSYRLLDPRQ